MFEDLEGVLDPFWIKKTKQNQKKHSKNNQTIKGGYHRMNVAIIKKNVYLPTNVFSSIPKTYACPK